MLSCWTIRCENDPTFLILNLPPAPSFRTAPWRSYFASRLLRHRTRVKRWVNADSQRRRFSVTASHLTRLVPLNQNCKGTAKRVRFQLTCSPLIFHPSQRAGSVSPGPGDTETTGDESAAVTEPERLRDLSALLVRNKPAVFHSVRERRVGRASQDAAASLYKLDSKVRDRATGCLGERQQFTAR